MVAALSATLATVGCDAILGLDADYRVATGGGDPAAGGGPAAGGAGGHGANTQGGAGGAGGAQGGAGGAGGGMCTEASCTVCRSCEDDQCVADDAGPSDDCNIIDACDGLGTCAKIDHLNATGIQKVVAVASKGQYVAVAGAYNASFTVGPVGSQVTIDPPVSGDDLFVIVFSSVDGTPIVGRSFDITTTDFDRAITAMDMHTNGDVYFTGALPNPDTNQLVFDNETATGPSTPGVHGYVARWQSMGDDSSFGTAIRGAEPIALDVDANHVAIAGSFSSAFINACSQSDNAVPGTHDAFVVIAEHDLGCIWGDTFGTTADEKATAVRLESTDQVILGGEFINHTTVLAFGSNNEGMIGGSGTGDLDSFVVSLDIGGQDLPPWAWGFAGEGGSESLYDLAIGDGGEIYMAGAYSGAKLTQSNQTGSVDIVDNGTIGEYLVVAELDSLLGNATAVRELALDATNLHIQLAATTSSVALGGSLIGELTLDATRTLGSASIESTFALELDDMLDPGWFRAHTFDAQSGPHRNLVANGDNLFLGFSASGTISFDGDTTPITPTDGSDIFLLAYRAPRIPRP